MVLFSIMRRKKLFWGYISTSYWIYYIIFISVGCSQSMIRMMCIFFCCKFDGGRHNTISGICMLTWRTLQWNKNKLIYIKYFPIHECKWKIRKFSITVKLSFSFFFARFALADFDAIVSSMILFEVMVEDKLVKKIRGVQKLIKVFDDILYMCLNVNKESLCM